MSYEKKFETREYIKSEIENRKVIFFDLMIWNEFFDNKMKEAIDIKSEIERLLVDRKIICPGSFTIVLESAQRESSEKRKGVFDYIRRYSKMIFFARPDITFENECKNILINEMAGICDVFERVDAFAFGVEAFGGPFSINWPTIETVSKDKLENATNELFSILVEAVPDFFSEIKLDQSLKNELSKIAVNASTGSKVEKEIFKEEFKAVCEFYLPNIQNAIKGALGNLAEMGKRPHKDFLKSDKRKMILKSRYFESCIALDTKMRLICPTLTSHDYFDSWHIANSLGFIDYAIVDSKWAEIIKQTKLDEKYGVKVFSAKPESLKDFLVELQQL